ncbi:hypothetical protein K8I85_13500, partial [bacterium]|nr:hypothetical protein [bacterium]
DEARTRLFVDAEVSPGISFFTQFLISHYSDFFVYAAYLRFEEVGGTGINLHAGVIPSTVGNWGPRTYSDRNPLVGVPLLWNHHTSLDPRVEQNSVAELLAARDTRSQVGLPVQYDNCWNGGVELWGQRGSFDWSVALLNGSTTYPDRDRSKQVPQVTSRVAWARTPSFILGVSGWAGPYMRDGNAALGDRDTNDYLNAGGGVDLAWTMRRVEIHFEVMHTSWEHPMLPNLAATSGYVEAKVRFLTRWFVASRAGFLEPSRITDGSGDSVPWDYPIRRVESGFGYRVAPRVTLKTVAQVNRFQGGAGSLDTDHYLVQLSAGF